MRPEEVYTLSVHKAEESFKKIWPTKNKLICGIVFAALAVGVILALNPLFNNYRLFISCKCSYISQYSICSRNIRFYLWIYI